MNNLLRGSGDVDFPYVQVVASLLSEHHILTHKQMIPIHAAPPIRRQVVHSHAMDWKLLLYFKKMGDVLLCEVRPDEVHENKENGKISI